MQEKIEQYFRENNLNFKRSSHGFLEAIFKERYSKSSSLESKTPRSFVDGLMSSYDGDLNVSSVDIENLGKLISFTDSFPVVDSNGNNIAETIIAVFQKEDFIRPDTSPSATAQCSPLKRRPASINLTASSHTENLQNDIQSASTPTKPEGVHLPIPPRDPNSPRFTDLLSPTSAGRRRSHLRKSSEGQEGPALGL